MLIPPHLPSIAATLGAPLASAQAAVVMVHGRGATAAKILELAQLLLTDGVAFVAPQAAGNTWYPNSFLSDIPTNEPGITSGLAAIAGVLKQVQAAGVPVRRTALLGFSQGACLTLEFAARHAARYGAVIGFSGGLIGPPGTPRAYPGSFSGTPVFLGCSDIDSHIPLARVHETAQVLTDMGAEVDTRIYPGMGHLVNDDELGAARALLARLAGR